MSSARVRWLVLITGLLVGLPGPASAHGDPTATLVRVIDTSSWSPPSPDPGGLAYLPATGKLFVSDAEVEETRVFRGANMFVMRKSGRLRRAFSVMAFTREPTDVAVRPRNKRTLYITDDVANRILIVRRGRDGRWGTRDDRARSFSTARFGSRDAEGLGFGRRSLFLTDGNAATLFRIQPGRNGKFDGVSPEGDDQVTSFDTGALGMRRPEDVVYDPQTGHLFIVSRSDLEIAEVTLSGELVNLIDISGSGIWRPAGIAMVRRSGSPNARVYVADRRRDNNQFPRENDGRIYVFSVTW